MLLRPLLQRCHERPQLAHFVSQLGRVVDHILTHLPDILAQRFILSSDRILQITQVIQRLLSILNHRFEYLIMILHLESEVLKCPHYHLIIVLQALLNNFTISFHLRDAFIDLLEDVELLCLVVDDVFEGVHFLVVFFVVFDDSIEEVLVLVDFVDYRLA